MNPDTTPTPRTDAEARDGYTYDDMGGRSSLQSCDYEKSKYGEIVPIDFARQLERELTEKTNEVARLREALSVAYTHNQNMHCYQTKGRLHEELNNQTLVLREAIKNLNKKPAIKENTQKLK